MTASRRHDETMAFDAEALRPRLFGIAYRMLGSVADAEDAVQETFLRWQQARLGGEPITAPEGWLVSVITRLCIDQLRSARVTRETYVGPWLPEPLVEDPEPEAETVVETAESLSLAFLVLLENLSPVERAAFLLHDVFDYQYAEIASIVGRTEASCRQAAKRARDRIDVGKPRYEVDRSEGERIAAEFLRASVDGDLPKLLSLVTEDVELVADGGGKTRAITKPVHGALPVAKLMIGIAPRFPRDLTVVHASVNGGAGIVAYDQDGHPFSVVSFDLVDGRIAAVRVISNPDKLRAVPEQHR